MRNDMKSHNSHSYTYTSYIANLAHARTRYKCKTRFTLMHISRYLFRAYVRSRARSGLLLSTLYQYASLHFAIRNRLFIANLPVYVIAL